MSVLTLYFMWTDFTTGMMLCQIIRHKMATAGSFLYDYGQFLVVVGDSCEMDCPRSA